MNSKELDKLRNELVSFYNNKGYKKQVKPYQKKALEISQLTDEALEEWYICNGKRSFLDIVFNDITDKQDEAKYKRLCAKVERDEELNDNEVEFVQEYEDSHKIEDSII